LIETVRSKTKKADDSLYTPAPSDISRSIIQT